MKHMLKSSISTFGMVFATMFGSLSAQTPDWSGYSNNCCPSPCQSSCYDWSRISFSAEGLYWRADQDKMSFAEHDVETDVVVFLPGGEDAIQTRESDAHVFDLNNKYSLGYRLRLDYDLPCNDWKLDLAYTHLLNHASRSVSAPNTSTDVTIDDTEFLTFDLISAYFPGADFGASLNRASAHWKLDFNDVQLNIGKNLCLTQCLSFTPFIGLKYLQINQTYKLKGHANPNPTLIVDLSGDGRTDIKTKYSGFGLQGGFLSFWNVGCGFNLYSEVSGGIVYGRAHSKYDQDFTSTRRQTTFLGVTSFVNTDSDVDFKDKLWTTRPNLDFAIGITWDYLLCDCYPLTLTTGWEYHYYFNQNFFRLTDSYTRGDLTLMGWTFGADIRF